MMERASGKGHHLALDNREKMSLSGINRVHSFEPKEIILETELGLLNIRGEKLGIKNLDLQQGKVEIEGHVEALAYARQGSSRGKEGFWYRIFH